MASGPKKAGVFRAVLPCRANGGAAQDGRRKAKWAAPPFGQSLAQPYNPYAAPLFLHGPCQGQVEQGADLNGDGLGQCQKAVHHAFSEHENRRSERA